LDVLDESASGEQFEIKDSKLDGRVELVSKLYNPVAKVHKVGFLTRRSNDMAQLLTITSWPEPGW